MKESRLLTIGMNECSGSGKEKRLVFEVTGGGYEAAGNETMKNQKTDKEKRSEFSDVGSEKKKEETSATSDLANIIKTKLVESKDENADALKNFLKNALADDGKIVKEEADAFMDRVEASLHAVGATTPVRGDLQSEKAIMNIAIASKLVNVSEWDAAIADGKKKETSSVSGSSDYVSSEKYTMRAKRGTESYKKKNTERALRAKEAEEALEEGGPEEFKQMAWDLQDQVMALSIGNSRPSKAKQERRELREQYNAVQKLYQKTFGKSIARDRMGSEEDREEADMRLEERTMRSDKLEDAKKKSPKQQLADDRNFADYQLNRGAYNLTAGRKAKVQRGMDEAEASMGKSGIELRSDMNPRWLARLAKTEREGGIVSNNGRKAIGRRAEPTREEDMYADGSDFPIRDFVRGQANKKYGANDKARADNNVLNARNLDLNTDEFLSRVQEIQKDSNYKKAPSYRNFVNQMRMLEVKNSDSNEMTKMLAHIIPQIEQELKTLAINTQKVEPFQIDEEGEQLPFTTKINIGVRSDVVVHIVANGESIDIQPNIQGGLWQDSKSRSFMTKHGVTFDAPSNDHIKTRYLRQGDPAETKSMVFHFTRPGRFEIDGKKLDIRDFNQQIEGIKKKDPQTPIDIIRSLDGKRSKALVDALGGKPSLAIDWQKVKNPEEKQNVLNELGKSAALTLNNFQFDKPYAFGSIPVLSINCTSSPAQSNLSGLFAQKHQELRISGLTKISDGSMGTGVGVGALILPDVTDIALGGAKVLSDLRADVLDCPNLRSVSGATLFDLLRNSTLKKVKLNGITEPSNELLQFLSEKPDLRKKVDLGFNVDEKVDEWVKKNRELDADEVKRLMNMKPSIGEKATIEQLSALSEKNTVAMREMAAILAKEVLAGGGLVDEWMVQNALERLEFSSAMETSAERVERLDTMKKLESKQKQIKDMREKGLSKELYDVMENADPKFKVSLGETPAGFAVSVRSFDGKLEGKPILVPKDGIMPKKDLKALEKLLKK